MLDGQVLDGLVVKSPTDQPNDCGFKFWHYLLATTFEQSCLIWKDNAAVKHTLIHSFICL